MNELQRQAVLLSLIEGLHDAGSWCGETHVQKGVYFLQKLQLANLGYDFTLYKHGPFSFDLRDELTSMRADDYLDIEPRPYPYGPSLIPGESSWLPEEFGIDGVEAEAESARRLAAAFGDRGVVDLEALATALYVRDEEGVTEEEIAERIVELKPHIDSERAESAVNEMNSIIEQLVQIP